MIAVLLAASTGFCPPGTLICGNGMCARPIDSSRCPPDTPSGRAIIAALPNCLNVGTAGGLCEADGECGTRNDLDNCETNRNDVTLHAPFWDIYEVLDASNVREQGLEPAHSPSLSLPPCHGLSAWFRATD